MLGEGGVELLDGWIVYGKYPFAFAEEAVRAARTAGIELTERVAHARAATAERGHSSQAASWHGRSPRAKPGGPGADHADPRRAGGATIATAMSWLAEPADALDGQSPASWIAAGRDRQKVELLARRDAGRLSQ